MGPDEHNAVREALDSFSRGDSPPVLAYDLGDARSAVLLRAVSARRALVGAVMVIMDTRAIKADAGGSHQAADAEVAACPRGFRRHAPGHRTERGAGAAPRLQGRLPPRPPAAAPISTKSSATSQTARFRALAAAAPASVKVSAAAAGKPPASALQGAKAPAAAAPAGAKASMQSAVAAKVVAQPAPAGRPHGGPAADPPLRTSVTRESTGPEELTLADSGRIPAPQAHGRHAPPPPPRLVLPERPAVRAGVRGQACARNLAGDRSPARRLAPQPHRPARPAAGASDQGQPAEAVRGAAALQVRRCAQCSAARDAQGGRRQRSRFDDRSSRHHGARGLARSPSGRVAIATP